MREDEEKARVARDKQAILEAKHRQTKEKFNELRASLQGSDKQPPPVTNF